MFDMLEGRVGRKEIFGRIVSVVGLKAGAVHAQPCSWY